MAIDKRLQVFDAEGNPVDYDILASDVKFNDGKDLPTKLDEMEDEIGEGGYTPPQGGIPKTDLAQSVQDTLDDVANKVDKVPGKGLSTNDYTTEEKTKLGNLPSNPVQSISVNGGAAQTPQNGNVNIQVQIPTRVSDLSDANNYDTSAEVTQKINNKLTNVSVEAISAGQAVLSGAEADGVLYLFLQQRGLTVTPNPLLFGASGGTLVISGVALVNAITVAVQSGDFTVDGAASKTIAAADANGTNNIAVAYTGSAGAGSGSIRVTCGETTVDVIVNYDADGIEGYTRVGYIQNTNDSYIDTGYIPNVNSKFAVEATIDELSTNEYLFGQRPGYCTNASEIIVASTQKVRWIFGTYEGSYQNDSNFDLNAGLNTGTKYSFVTDDNKISVTPEGGTTLTKTANGKTAGTPSGNTVLSVFIFTTHSSNGASQLRLLAKIHSFKIYEGSTLVRDYVPAQRDIDGVYGLYDLVNDTFITAAEGTTALSGGN